MLYWARNQVLTRAPAASPLNGLPVGWSKPRPRVAKVVVLVVAASVWTRPARIGAGAVLSKSSSALKVEASGLRPIVRAVVAFLVSAVILSLPPQSPPATARARTADPWAQRHVARELLVGFRQDDSTTALPSRLIDRRLTAFGVEQASRTQLSQPVYRLRFGPGVDLQAKQKEVLQDPRVAFAEPNYLLSATLVPNDPNYGQQWALPKIGADRAWDLTTGGPVVIAMLDTGISPTHPDLQGRLVPGKNFITPGAEPLDDNGHGTFTAGIAAASGNNGIGVAGMSWSARLMPVKILDQDGRGPVSAFAEGIRFAVDGGAQIVNVSAGIPVPSQTMEAAVSYALGQRVTVVAASGNVADGVQNYPAAYPGVIAVGASTQTDGIADFSSYGSYVTLAAPGVGIVSTYSRSGDTYAQMSGTSASTPFVSGTIALMLSVKSGDLTPRMVREMLKATAVDILTAGFDPQSGYGRLDTYHAVLLSSNPLATLTGALVSPPSGKSTDAFVLTASGFAPNEPVAVWLTLSDGTYRYLRYPSIFADSLGRLQASLGTGVALPPGTQAVTAFGESSRQVAYATFAVTQAVNTQAFARVPSTADTPTSVYFAETGHTLSNAFLTYWRDNGGLAIFGFPISEEFVEVSPTDGKPYTVQYFERNRFEYHPELKDVGYEVLLGLLGRDTTVGRTFPVADAPFESTPSRAYFPKTKHSLSGDFLAYWLDNGGLVIFGYPISEPFVETSKTDGKPYLVQYFERNRFELHPEKDPAYSVLLGLLGSEFARTRGYIAP